MADTGGMIARMRVLVLTGPPAVGKTSIGRLLAATRLRCALADIDDVRHLVVTGHAAPWDGDEGQEQQRLGVINGCGMAGNFTGHGIDVVIVDVVTDQTAALYRQLLPEPLIVQLTATYDEALRRAHTRKIFLTWSEFRRLHDEQAHLTDVDHRLDTTHLNPRQTVAELAGMWCDPVTPNRPQRAAPTGTVMHSSGPPVQDYARRRSAAPGPPNQRGRAVRSDRRVRGAQNTEAARPREGIAKITAPVLPADARRRP